MNANYYYYDEKSDLSLGVIINELMTVQPAMGIPDEARKRDLNIILTGKESTNERAYEVDLAVVSRRFPGKRLILKGMRDDSNPKDNHIWMRVFVGGSCYRQRIEINWPSAAEVMTSDC